VSGVDLVEVSESPALTMTGSGSANEGAYNLLKR